MRTRRCLLAVLIVLAGTSTAWSKTPPARPLSMTADQFTAIRSLEAQPEHQSVLDVHATYKSERERSLDFTRASDDFWSVVYHAGFPGAMLIVLILAAPL